MVRLTRIYTRGGDQGDTGLANGNRVGKDTARIAAYGTVDEANAVIGLARLHTDGAADQMLARIQNDLFDVGADLATPEAEAPRHPPLRVTARQVARLEREIDAINGALQPLESFILPGGSAASAHLHLARTVTRRAERLTVALARQATVNPEAVKYLNRLSDHLFVLARQLNDNGRGDVLWVPGGSDRDG